VYAFGAFVCGGALYGTVLCLVGVLVFFVIGEPGFFGMKVIRLVNGFHFLINSTFSLDLGAVFLE